MSILKVENLSYDYVTKAGLVHAVKEATAEFEEGKMYAIVGRSGSGKSTLISLLAGLDEPKTGEIYINGEPLSEMDRDKFRRGNVGMICSPTEDRQCSKRRSLLLRPIRTWTGP